MQKNPRKALFLDRDGVINVDHGFVFEKEKFDFIDGIFELVSAANKSGYFVVVITNQSGIGRGYFSEDKFLGLMGWMQSRFEDKGATIDRFYYSPYHPENGLGVYRKDDETRKPRPGMIYRARDELRLSLEKSVLVGDKSTDIMAGLAAGVGKNIILSAGSHNESICGNYIMVKDLKDVIYHL